MAVKTTIRDQNFDSVLEPAGPGRPARLRLRLLINLIPRDPSIPGSPDGPDHPAHLATAASPVRYGQLQDANRQRLFACRSWTVAEFNAYKIAFKRMVELSWNNQLVLLPPVGTEDIDGFSDADYRLFIDNPNIPARLLCDLEIQFASSSSRSPHAVIEVVHLDERVKQPHFRSRSRRMSDEDVQFRSSTKDQWPNIRFNQVVAAHEVGHWLRGYDSHGDLEAYLPHVDAVACALLPDDERPANCGYGLVAGTRLALMGSGNLATDYEALIWLKRAREHTNTIFGWKWIHRVHFNKGLAPISDRQKRLTGQRPAKAA